MVTRQFGASAVCLRDNPPYLLGKRVWENSDMDGAINAAATANNFVAIYGSIQDAFTVVDRVGSSIELVQHVLDPTTGRPTGQRGALLWFRTGSAVTNVSAAKLLDIPTSA